MVFMFENLLAYSKSMKFVEEYRDPELARKLVERIITLSGIRYSPPVLPLAPVAVVCWLMEKAFTLAGQQPPFSTRSIKFFTENSSFTTT